MPIPLDLTALKKFNPALVYQLDYEFSRLELNPIQQIQYNTAQNQDILDAYLFAQEKILPFIEEQGISAIKPAQLCEWLHQLHRLAANTLAKDRNCPAGEYTTKKMFLWRFDGDISRLWEYWLQLCFSYRENEVTDLLREVITQGTGDANLELESMSPFLNILKKHSLNLKEAKEVTEKINDMKPPPGFLKHFQDTARTLVLAQKSYFESRQKARQLQNEIGASKEAIQKAEDNFSRQDAKRTGSVTELTKILDQLVSEENRRPFNLVINYCIEQYYAQKFDQPEMATIEKIITIFPSPAEKAKKMECFFEDLLSAWKQCDPQNTKQIIDLAKMAFLGITNIHPYFDCNGRLGTLLMNIILVYFKKPSILLRISGEGFDPNSAYCQAIRSIKFDPDSFSVFIDNQIQHVESNPLYFQNDSLMDHVVQRAKLAKFFTDQINAGTSTEAILENYESILTKNITVLKDLPVERMLAFLFEELSKRFADFPKPKPFVPSNMFKTSLTPDEKEMIKKRLAQETDTLPADWKIPDNGQAWLSTGEEKAQILQKTLKTLGFHTQMGPTKSDPKKFAVIIHKTDIAKWKMWIHAPTNPTEQTVIEKTPAVKR